MKVKWSSLPETIQEILKKMIIDPENSNKLRMRLFPILTGAHGMGFEWKKDPIIEKLILEGIPSFLNTTSNFERSRNLATVFYHLGEAGFKWNHLSSQIQDSLMNGMKKLVVKMDVENFNKLVHG
jgi:hypothetical protein